MSEWHFLRPLWLAALPLALVGVWWYRHRRLRAGRWRDLVDEALQPYVLTSGSDTREGRWLPWWLAVVLVLLIVAMAGPVRERLPQPVYRNAEALVIALDLSRSMNAQDLLPTRLDRARLKVRDLLSQREEGDTALLVFAGDAFTVTPLTDDTATIEAMLESLTTQIMPRQGSLLTPALMRAGRLFDDAGATEGRVLLLTDGVADRSDAIDAAKQLAARGFDISVLAVGTPEGDVVRNALGELVKDDTGQIVVARTDVSALASVSAAGNGRFAMLTADDTDLDALLSAGEAAFAGGVLSEDFETDVWREEGPLIVLLCLPFVAWMFRRGLIICLAAFMVLPPPQASAGVWQDLWQTPDQQAQEKFAAEEFPAAAEQFNDRQWRAAAAFRAGDYKESAQLLNGFDTSDAHYNRGNALALAGEIDAAKDAYRAALARDAEHEDARYNLDLLEQLPEPPEQEGDSSDQEQQQNDQSGEQQESENGDSGEQDSSQSGDSSSSSAQNEDGEEGERSDDPSEDAQQEEQTDQEQAEAGQDEESEGEEREAEARTLSDAEQEQDLAAEQWLRQVPDDPGGLLRRKFERQYRLRYQGRPEEPEAW